MQHTRSILRESLNLAFRAVNQPFQKFVRESSWDELESRILEVATSPEDVVVFTIDETCERDGTLTDGIVGMAMCRYLDKNFPDVRKGSDFDTLAALQEILRKRYSMAAIRRWVAEWWR